MSDRTLTFSQEQGFEEVPRPLQLGQLPPAARTMIFNELYVQLEKTSVVVYEVGRRVVGGVWSSILQAKHMILDKRFKDEWDSSFNACATELKYRIVGDPPEKVFDLIQFIMRLQGCPPEFTAGMIVVFRHCQLAYAIDMGPPVTIVPAATAEEREQLTRNLNELRAARLDGCTTHLRNASQCINDGDWRGSVHESINAVESVAKTIIPGANTLKKALAPLEKQGTLQHKAFKEALDKLYGYTSDEKGIRHSLLSAQANVTIDEAVFMLGACASFASYLWRKHKAASAP